MTMPCRSVAQPDSKADVVTHPTSYEATFFLQGLPYGHTNHGLPVESMSQSGGSAGQSETKADTILAAESINYYRMNHGPPANPPVVCNPYVNGDAYANYTSIQPTSFHGSGMPSSFTCIGTQDAGVDRTISPIYGNSLSHSEWTATTLAGSATGMRYTHADYAPNDSVSSAVPPDPFTPITAQFQQRVRPPSDQPRKFKKERKKIPTTPSQSLRRPSGIQGTPKRRLCHLPGCGRPFTQRRELLRHLREVHRVGVGTYREWHCVPCGVSWPSSRGYMWKGHLMKVHPEVDADEEYKNAKENGRSFEPQERISSPILGHNRRVRAEPQVHPSTPPLQATAMTKPPIPPPASAFPQVDYDPQYKSAELAMRSDRSDLPQSETLNSTRVVTLFSSTEERPRVVKDLGANNYTQNWHANNQDGCIDVDPSSNPVPAYALMAAPPVSEHHGNRAPVTPTVVPPGTAYSSLAHALDDGIRTNRPRRVFP